MTLRKADYPTHYKQTASLQPGLREAQESSQEGTGGLENDHRRGVCLDMLATRCAEMLHPLQDLGLGSHGPFVLDRSCSS